MNMKQLVFDLCGSPGVTGREEAAAETISRFLSSFGGVYAAGNGNLFGEFCGSSREADAPHVLLDAHMDQVGMTVARIDRDGFVHFVKCGGVDPRILVGKPVVIYGKKRVKGIISCMPPHLTGKDDKKAPAIEEMQVDTGLSKEKVQQLISLGDRILVNYAPVELLGGRVASPALDNRAGVAAILRCLEILKEEKEPLTCKLTVLFSVQEEFSGSGAATGAFRCSPDEAVVVDVSFAQTPDCKEDNTAPMGSGVMIGLAPSLSPRMSQSLLRLAEKNSIPYTRDVAGGRTGTNADQISCIGKGVDTALLSIPLRYMHTAVEVVQLSDIEETARLMAAYVRQCGRADGEGRHD